MRPKQDDGIVGESTMALAPEDGSNLNRLFTAMRSLNELDIAEIRCVVSGVLSPPLHDRYRPKRQLQSEWLRPEFAGLFDLHRVGHVLRPELECRHLLAEPSERNGLQRRRRLFHLAV